METVRRVAVANDLSGFGRCSLTVALPVLAAMGFQPCPVPTMLLSAHTGYESPYIVDFTQDMAAYIQHWERMQLSFDGVYTGFLGNEQQAQLLEPLMQQIARKSGLRLVDPAMADHGRLYATCTPTMVQAMSRLARLASVITPNLTEACLLAGEEYAALMATPMAERRRKISSIGQRLLGLGCEAAVITGIPEGELLFNAVVEKKGETWISTHRVEGHFAGTGDVFSAVLCGSLLRGVPLQKAVGQTAAFVEQVTQHTAAMHTPEQDGIAFEPFLGQLCVG